MGVRKRPVSYREARVRSARDAARRPVSAQRGLCLCSPRPLRHSQCHREFSHGKQRGRAPPLRSRWRTAASRSSLAARGIGAKIRLVQPAGPFLPLPGVGPEDWPACLLREGPLLLAAPLIACVPGNGPSGHCAQRSTVGVGARMVGDGDDALSAPRFHG